MEKAITICAALVILAFALLSVSRMIHGKDIVTGANLPVFVRK